MKKKTLPMIEMIAKNLSLTAHKVHNKKYDLTYKDYKVTVLMDRRINSNRIDKDNTVRLTPKGFTSYTQATGYIKKAFKNLVPKETKTYNKKKKSTMKKVLLVNTDSSKLDITKSLLNLAGKNVSDETLDIILKALIKDKALSNLNIHKGSFSKNKGTLPKDCHSKYHTYIQTVKGGEK